MKSKPPDHRNLKIKKTTFIRNFFPSKKKIIEYKSHIKIENSLRIFYFSQNCFSGLRKLDRGSTSDPGGFLIYSSRGLVRFFKRHIDSITAKIKTTWNLPEVPLNEAGHSKRWDKGSFADGAEEASVDIGTWAATLWGKRTMHFEGKHKLSKIYLQSGPFRETDSPMAWQWLQ